MKNYQIIWKSVDLNRDIEIFDSVIVSDVQFKDQYVQIDMETDDNKVIYIPYYRIVEITRIGIDNSKTKVFFEM